MVLFIFAKKNFVFWQVCSKWLALSMSTATLSLYIFTDFKVSAPNFALISLMLFIFLSSLELICLKESFTLSVLDKTWEKNSTNTAGRKYVTILITLSYVVSHINRSPLLLTFFLHDFHSLLSLSDSNWVDASAA